MHLTIDFETRSKCDLKRCGPWKYAADLSTEVMCLAVKEDAKAPRLFIPEPFKSWLPANHGLPLISADEVLFLIVESDTNEAHNAEFETAIWHHVLHKRRGWMDLQRNKLRCSASRAAMCSLPRGLGDACAVLGLPVQKDKDGHAIMMKFCKPRYRSRLEPCPECRGTGKDFIDNVCPDCKGAKGTKVEEEYWYEDATDFVKLCRYCLTDVNAEYELSRALPPLPPTELDVWMLDQRMNSDGVKVDKASCQAWISEIAKDEETLLAEWQKLSRNTLDSPRQVVATLDFFKSEFDVDLVDLCKDTIADALHDLPLADEEEAPI